MRKDAHQQFDWSGNLETLEDRLFMSADPLGGLLGGSIEHHAIVDDLPPIQHQVVAEQPPAVEHHGFVDELPPLDQHLQSEADFWIDSDNLRAIEEELGQIEQTLANAHDQSGLTQVRTDYGFDGTGQTVAVIDSGIAYDHFALGGGLGSNFRVVGGWDFTGENDADPYDDGAGGSHGTHVSGIIGADGGINSGVAPGVDLVGLRVFDDAGDGYFSWVENALQWVHDNRNNFENPITAVNLSLGVASWNSDSIPSWANLENEFNLLKQDGIFISVSAGNSYTSFNQTGLSYPAASQYVVPVASVDDSGLLSYYSQRNSRVIAAPGRGIVSTVPDYAGNNNGITDDYASFSGTSMAAPYVAGASVIIREAMEFVGYTNITQDTIYDHMIDTADSFFDSETNAYYNRLNLESAIDALMPADDFGSTIATAHNLGTINASSSMSGAITTLDDVDYFKFTAASNGTVTFTASSMTHSVDAAWDVSGGTGTWSGANNEILTVQVVAGQEYSVGFSSDDGLGYYDLDIDAESSFTFTDWGLISYAQYQGVSITGENWFHVAADADGYFTTQALFDSAGGQISLELYNSSLELIDTGNASGGESRVDYYGSLGDELYIKAIGTNSDVDFRLTNLVSVAGTTVNVAGTAGDDTFSFSAGSTHQLSVNGVTYSFSEVSVDNFQFDGAAGNDTISLTGSTEDETATLDVSYATFEGASYAVTAGNIQNISAYGGGGNDEVLLHDSAGDDLYKAWSDRVQMTGDGYSNYAQDFEHSFGYSSTGFDLAMVYDSAGDDLYKTWSDRVFMRGDGYYSYAQGFAQTYAYASTGDDKVINYDSIGDDTYKAWSDRVLMQGEGYLNYSQNFDQSYAYSSTGNDIALIYDTAGDDLYRAWSDQVLMTGDGYFSYANGFEQTYAYSSGGDDRATMYDSLGDDTYKAWTDRVLMTGDDYRNSAEGFGETYAYASTGFDLVMVYDSAGDDIYKAWSNRVLMYGEGYLSYANGFDQSYAYSTTGDDRAVLYDTTGDDLFRVWSDRALMTGEGYLSYAQGFAQQYGNASSGNDRAIFYDSLGDDSYRVWSNRALMTGDGYLSFAYGFDLNQAFSSGGNDVATLYDTALDDRLQIATVGILLSNDDTTNMLVGFSSVTAHSENGGNDVAEVEAVDYLFSLVGDWNA